MKFGFRKPSLKKTIKARTTGAIKRKAKGAVNPLYGKKGMGFIKDPRKVGQEQDLQKDDHRPIKEASLTIEAQSEAQRGLLFYAVRSSHKITPD